MLFVAVSMNAQKTFEGEIEIHDFVKYSKDRKSTSLWHNSISDCKLIFKGEIMKQIELEDSVTYLYWPDAGYVYVYYPNLKEGVKVKYDYFEKSQSLLFPISLKNESTKRVYNIKPTDEQKTFLGSKCKVYKGTVEDTESFMNYSETSNVEIWMSTEYKMPQVYKVYNYCFTAPGLMMKMEWQHKAQAALLGKNEHCQYSYVTSVKPRTVSDDELMLPNMDNYIISKEGSQWMKMEKKHRKLFVKTQKDKTKDAPQGDVKFNIEEEWNF